MDLEERDLQIRLFETYESLLTDTQKKYFYDYYYADLSLTEIASNYSVSRNAVFDQIKKTIANIKHYEENLHLLEIKNLLNEEENLKNKEKILELLN